MTARPQLEFARRLAEVATVRAHACGDWSVHAQPARQLDECVVEDLVRRVCHDDRPVQRLVSGVRDRDVVASRSREVVAADMQRKTATQVYVRRGGHGLEHDRAAGEQEPHDQRDGSDAEHCRETDPGTAAPRARVRGATERNGLDALVCVLAAPRHHRHERHFGRHGQVAAAAVLDVEQAHAVARTDAQPAARRIDDIAFAQPGRFRHGCAVAERDLAAFDRLQEQLPVVQCDPRERALARRRKYDRVARAADADRKVFSRQRTFAERIAQDQFGRSQMGSSQRTTTSGGGAPGSTFNSLRTSRYPWRVPTTV
jgi:hypothetical protein